MKIFPVWEHLETTNATQRMKVFGGWLVMTYLEEALTMCFIPDPLHQWKVK